MNTILPGYGVDRASTPIQINGKVAGNIGRASLGGNGVDAASSPFTSMFQDAVGNVRSLDAVVAQDNYNLSIGDVDNLGEMQVNSERALTAFRLLIQMRNNVLDSYSEIMRMSI